MTKLIQTGLITKNRKANFEYEVAEDFDAGIVLQGSEVKSLRLNGCNIADAYADIRTSASGSEELWLVNLSIPEYKYGGKFNHKPDRLRKLLLHKREIKKLIGKIKQKGFTLIPLEIFFNDKGIAKIKIGLCKGKSKHDKRETIKERDWQREKSRNMKGE